MFKRIESTPAPQDQQGLENAAPEGLLSVVATTMQGLEPVLQAELEQLGAHSTRPSKRAVEWKGDWAQVYKACYTLRTAIRVLVRIHSFKAFNEKQFYNEVRAVEWSKYIDVTQTLAVDAILAGNLFKNSHFVELLTKDAVVDQFRDLYGRRPDVNTHGPHLRIFVRINGNQCDLLLDASGDSLHLRGYRRDTVEAPLNEVLAAGLIGLSGWDGQSPFADAMCGSGTLPIEAAMLAMRIPAQRFREIPFGFTKWKTFDAKTWKNVRQEADEQTLTTPPFPIWASDKESRARNSTSINAMSAGLESILHIERAAFEKVDPPAPNGLLMLNPPYDQRLPVEEVKAYYQGIADVLKHRWAGWTAWVFSGHLEAMKHFGLRASRRIPLLNASIECTFQRYDLYAGSKFQGVEAATNQEDQNDISDDQ